MVFDSGQRCRVSIWPVVPAARSPAADPRFLVFESEEQRLCVRVGSRVEVSQLTAEDLLRLYHRAEPLPSLAPA